VRALFIMAHMTWKLFHSKSEDDLIVQWLEHYAANFQVMNSNPTHTCAFVRGFLMEPALDYNVPNVTRSQGK